MGVVITPESELGKELAKWNVRRPFTPFPQMLYMAQKRPDGVMSVGEVHDGIFGGQPGSAEAFTSRCQCIVENEQERAVKLEQGWRPTPKEAYARLQAKDDAMSTAAAHRAYEDRNMSDAAKAEIAQAEAESEEQLAEVPEKRRPGRPRKIA